MTLAKNAVTAVPNFFLSAVAVVGMAMLIVLSVRDLPIEFDD